MGDIGWCNHLTVTQGVCEMCGERVSGFTIEPLVIGLDLARENAALRKRVEELEAALKEEGGWKAEAHRMFERTEKAERERDEFASKAVEMELLWSGTNAELEDAKADLDAALDWIDTHPSRRSLDVMRALLEKRRKRG